MPSRRARLVAALGFLELRWREPAPGPVRALRSWLDSWRGLGDVVTGLTAEGLNLDLRQFPTGWRATFYVEGMAHSILRGTAWEPTPWRAVQSAAWKALAGTRRPA